VISIRKYDVMKLEDVEKVFLRRSPTKKALLDFFENAPNDEVYTAEELVDRLKLGASQVQKICKELTRKGIISSFRKGIDLIYGNHKAIKKLKKRYGWK